eukprot:11417595-Heterocapsa_arctica.AAC.1
MEVSLPVVHLPHAVQAFASSKTMLPLHSPAARLPTLPLSAACAASADPSPALARDSGSFLSS